MTRKVRRYEYAIAERKKHSLFTSAYICVKVYKCLFSRFLLTPDPSPFLSLVSLPRLFLSILFLLPLFSPSFCLPKSASFPLSFAPLLSAHSLFFQCFLIRFLQFITIALSFLSFLLYLLSLTIPFSVTFSYLPPPCPLLLVGRVLLHLL